MWWTVEGYSESGGTGVTGAVETVAAMSTAVLAAIAVILCVLFRLLNVNSQPQRPNVFCGDAGFLDAVLKISPMVREP